MPGWHAAAVRLDPLQGRATATPSAPGPPLQAHLGRQGPARAGTAGRCWRRPDECRAVQPRRDRGAASRHQHRAALSAVALGSLSGGSAKSSSVGGNRCTGSTAGPTPIPAQEGSPPSCRASSCRGSGVGHRGDIKLPRAALLRLLLIESSTWFRQPTESVGALPAPAPQSVSPFVCACLQARRGAAKAWRAHVAAVARCAGCRCAGWHPNGRALTRPAVEGGGGALTIRTSLD